MSLCAMAILTFFVQISLTPSHALANQRSDAAERPSEMTGVQEKPGGHVSPLTYSIIAVALGLLAGIGISSFRMRKVAIDNDRTREDLKRNKDQLELMIEERTREATELRKKLEREGMQKQQMEHSLQNIEAKYRSLVDSTEDSIYVVDRDCRYLFMNKQHLNRLDRLAEEVIGHFYLEFHTSEETAHFIENVSNVFDLGESCQIEHMSSRDNRFFLQTLSPVKDQSGKIIAVTVVSKDITNRKTMEEELRALSLTDELTGLYNRRGFIALAEQCFRLANRMHMKVPVGYADLDGLKAINDSFGHQEGDKALVEAADAFRESFRDSDIIARLGGDEFVVVPIANNGSGIEAALDRLQKNIALRNQREGRNYRLSVSIGVTYYDPRNPCTIEEILDRGDKIMYEQKKAKSIRTTQGLHQALGPGSFPASSEAGGNERLMRNSREHGAGRLIWDDTFSVDIVEIDEQHRKMIGMINDLHRAMDKGYEAWMLSDLVHGLIDYASTHFRTEEDYMAKFGYAGYQEHEAEHDRFVGKVLDYQSQLNVGGVVSAPELMAFLKDWLVRHILGTDKKYVQLFREKGLG